MTLTLSKVDQLHEIEQFLYREARYADEHQYEHWEALWADDGIYWVPANGDDIDPEKEMSHRFPPTPAFPPCYGSSCLSAVGKTDDPDS